METSHAGTKTGYCSRLPLSSILAQTTTLFNDATKQFDLKLKQQFQRQGNRFNGGADRITEDYLPQLIGINEKIRRDYHSVNMLESKPMICIPIVSTEPLLFTNHDKVL